MEGPNKELGHIESRPLSLEKQELLALEAEGKYVFHGTASDVEVLEPRQAVDAKRGPDGEPAVFASDKAEYAIFMAIVNRRNCPQGSYAEAGSITSTIGQTTSIRLKFGMTQQTADQLQETASGWVYVFDKSQFTSHATKEGVEFVAHVPVMPVHKIKVLKLDLPEDIEIVEE